MITSAATTPYDLPRLCADVARLPVDIDPFTRELKFQVVDFYDYDAEIGEEDDNNVGMSGGGGGKPRFRPKQYNIRMFGITDRGESISVLVQNYQPRFYLSVPASLQITDVGQLYALRKNLEDYIRNRSGFLRNTTQGLINVQLVNRIEFYWFTNKLKRPYFQLTFGTKMAYFGAKKIFANPNNQSIGITDLISGKILNFELYEYNLPLIIKFMHQADIKGAGWISLAPSTIANGSIYELEDQVDNAGKCQINVKTSWDQIEPIENDENAEFLVLSYDIECGSSHGDFPLAIKDYRKHCRELIDIIYDLLPNIGTQKDFLTNTEIIQTCLGIFKQFILSMFFRGSDMMDFAGLIKTGANPDILRRFIDQIPNISYVYTKMNIKPDEKKIDIVINRIFQTIDICHREKESKVKINFRDTLTRRVTAIFNRSFPPVEGDEIIQIGATLRRGRTKIGKFIFTLGSCGPVPDTRVFAYATEADMLLGYRDFVQLIDPDMIIGYNTFKFDDKYIYDRAQQLNIAEEFMNFSRIIGQSSELTKLNLSSSAMGDNRFNIISMTGRITLDIMVYIRRGYQLDSYSLDFACSTFFKKELAKTADGKYDIAYNRTDRTLRIGTKDTTGVLVDNFLKFSDDDGSSLIGGKYWAGGKKCRILAVDSESITVDVSDMTFEEFDNACNQVMIKMWYQTKDDVSPADIFRFQREGPHERAIIAKYCIQDCELVMDLEKKLEITGNSIAMSNVCSIPLQYNFVRGQGIKLQSLVFKECAKLRYIVRTLPQSSGSGGAFGADDGEGDDIDDNLDFLNEDPDEIEDAVDGGGGDDDSDSDDENDVSYEGAIVLPPKTGIYFDDIICVFDYNSLYPSSMISENISHDTIVTITDFDLAGNLIKQSGNPLLANLPDYEYIDVSFDILEKNPADTRKHPEKIKTGTRVCRYVQFRDGSKGIIPEILKSLLAARKATRKIQATVKDKFKWALLECQQLAFKVVANSLYGQCGARTSKIRFMELAASTTAVGRKLILYARDTLCSRYSFCENVYGDTDSVFQKVTFYDQTTGEKLRGRELINAALKWGEEACKVVTAGLRPPHNLEFEKACENMILLSKKRYVYWKWEPGSSKPPKLTAMGLVLKRRDNAQIVKEVYNNTILKLLSDKSVVAAAEYVKNMATNILEGRVDMNKLIITKSLSANYKNPDRIAHAVLAKRIGIRDPGNKPNSNDRIGFVYFHNPGAKLQGDKIELPSYIREHGLQPDYEHYVTNQIMKPLSQIFAIVLEQLPGYIPKPPTYYTNLESQLLVQYNHNEKKAKEKLREYREKETCSVLFGPQLTEYRDKMIRMTGGDNTKRVKKTYFDVIPKMRGVNNTDVLRMSGATEEEITYIDSFGEKKVVKKMQKIKPLIGPGITNSGAGISPTSDTIISQSQQSPQLQIINEFATNPTIPATPAKTTRRKTTTKSIDSGPQNTEEITATPTTTRRCTKKITIIE